MRKEDGKHNAKPGDHVHAGIVWRSLFTPTPAR
jgi:hypothetical protein